MTRIVGGELGGRRLATPAGRQTRPTSDRVREALFSTLSTLLELEGSRFADLFAGSGAVGLEAASRGAAEVLLVDSDARAVRAIKENVAALGLAKRCTVRAQRVEAVVGRFDVVFLDPPYDLDEAALARLLAAPLLAEEGVIVVERSARSPEPVWGQQITPERVRRYGETVLWYGRAVPPSPTESGGMR